jgi:hypothetical protein
LFNLLISRCSSNFRNIPKDQKIDLRFKEFYCGEKWVLKGKEGKGGSSPFP